jgi:hypothetical protein
MLKQFNFCLKAFNRNFKFSSKNNQEPFLVKLINCPAGWRCFKKAEWCSGSKSWSQGFALAISCLHWFKPEAMKMRPNNCIVSKINYRLPYELNCRVLTSKNKPIISRLTNPYARFIPSDILANFPPRIRTIHIVGEWDIYYLATPVIRLFDADKP